jgi:hypothetical protein
LDSHRENVKVRNAGMLVQVGFENPQSRFLKKSSQTLHLLAPQLSKVRNKNGLGIRKKSFQTFQTFQSTITGSSAIWYDSSMKGLCEQ